MYSKKVMEHFMKPKNSGVIKNADGVGQAGNIVCGDVMFIFIKVEHEVITDLKFKALGCVAAIATSSIVTELAKGKTLDQALEMSNQDIVEALGGLPPVKVHCSLLAIDALKEAIYDYLKRQGREISAELEKSHERISKEVQGVEGKFGEFVEKQREFLLYKK